MKIKSTHDLEPVLATLATTLTAREIKVLCHRFGIEALADDEDETLAAGFFLPPTDGNGGQGGAPLHAVKITKLTEALDDGIILRCLQRARKPCGH